MQPEATKQPAEGTKESKNPELSIDMNGRECHLCGLPFPERSDRRYVQRRDCGNESIFEHPENRRKPLIQFNRPGSTAYCELNVQKMCADAIYNRDFLFQTKAIDARSEKGSGSFNMNYCYLNGWLAPEIKALQHDYEGMKLKAEDFCKAQKNTWNTTMTQIDADAATFPTNTYDLFSLV